MMVQLGNAEIYHRSGFAGAGFALRCWLCSASADVMMGHVYGALLPAPAVQFCGESVLSLCVCENCDGWLVAWGLCGCWDVQTCMLIRFSTGWLLPFALL